VCFTSIIGTFSDDTIKPEVNNVDNKNQTYNTLEQMLEKTTFITKMNTINQNHLTNYFTVNNRQYSSVFVNELPLGDIPLSLVFEKLYNPDVICIEYGKNLNFLTSYHDYQTDHTFKFNKINEQGWNERIPKFMQNGGDTFQAGVFESEKSLQDYLNYFDALDKNRVTTPLTYQLNFTHPIKKKDLWAHQL